MFDVSNLNETNMMVLAMPALMVGFALLVMLMDMFSSEERPALYQYMPWVTVAGSIVAIYTAVRYWDFAPVSFQGAAVMDQIALGVGVVVAVSIGLSVLLSTEYTEAISKQPGEYYALMLLCGAGMMMMGSATDFITVFIALEIFSLALYILSGINRDSKRSMESAMKYFLLGAFASAFFVYGAALVYGATGSTQFNAIATALADGAFEPILLYAGMALLVVGFGFKVSLVPFHMWTPDVYQGAPTPVTAFMSVGTKVAAFAAFGRVLMLTAPEQKDTVGWILAILAVLTMILGNFAALRQMSLKRMLAYSSIAHAGYIMVGLVPGTAEGASAAVFYLFAYAFMNIGAFAVIIMLENAQEGDALQNRAAGIGTRWPMLAIAMTIFMFSLSGLPPLAGFWGKVFVFRAAINGGWIILTILAVLSSAVSAYYYLRVVVAMFFQEADSSTVVERRSWPALSIGVALSAIITVLIGILPGIWTGLFLAQ